MFVVCVWGHYEVGRDADCVGLFDFVMEHYADEFVEEYGCVVWCCLAY